MDSKTLAINTHKILKEMGHELPLGHVYELFSKLSGHKSWNVAKTKDSFEVVLKSIIPQIGEGNYEVKVTIDEGGLELKKRYRVLANSEKEANNIVSNYIKYRKEGDDSYLENEEVKILAENETEEEFLKENWEIIWNESEPKVQKESTWRIMSTEELSDKVASFTISPEELRKQLLKR